ncbi:MAG: ACT domain-containing protein [Coriobacteriales bacterium]|nr:ACT domain-containing protein [Coriobacteriales bacterium]
MRENKVVVTVIGPDKPGIIAKVATTLSNYNANILDIRQGVLDDIFQMTMIAQLDEQANNFNQIQEALKQNAKELKLQILMQREDVFDFMYNV